MSKVYYDLIMYNAVFVTFSFLKKELIFIKNNGSKFNWNEFISTSIYETISLDSEFSLIMHFKKGKHSFWISLKILFPSNYICKECKETYWKFNSFSWSYDLTLFGLLSYFKSLRKNTIFFEFSSFNSILKFFSLNWRDEFVLFSFGLCSITDDILEDFLSDFVENSTIFSICSFQELYSFYVLKAIWMSLVLSPMMM